MASTKNQTRKPYTAEEKARHKLQAAARKAAADALIKAHAEEYADLLAEAKRNLGVEDRSTRLTPAEKAQRLLAKADPEVLAALLAAASK